MAGLRLWLRPPRNLLVLFALVTLLPAATLVVLGVRLLQQDRALAEQRRGEMLEHAADRAVRALEQEILSLTRRLKEGFAPADVPDGAVYAVLRAGRIDALPAARMPYYPDAPGAKEPPAAPFEALEALEFRKQDLGGALEIARKLSASADPLVRAGALLRQARLLRKMQRADEALEVYRKLGEITAAAIGGMPADLVALRGRCTVLEEQSRTQLLRQEAAAIAAGLRAGRWRLNRVSFLHVAGQVAGWSGEEVRAGAEGEAMAAALEWLHQNAGTDEAHAAGVRWQSPVAILWTPAAGSTRALLAGPRYLEAHWLPQMRKAAAPARAYLAGWGGAPPAALRRVQRAAADTGLPWTLVVTEPGTVGWGELPGQRRLLLVGLGALLVLIAAVSYLIYRSITREMAVARLQSDFVAAVSHEFRTPLTSLRQFQDLVADEEALPPGKRRAYQEAQVRATDRLQRLVEALLDFGRMEAGRRPYRFEKLDAGALAQDVTEEFRREAVGHGFAVECSVNGESCPVDADSEALSRALWNLLDNAVKYSGESRRIDVGVERDGDVVRLLVRDYGLGVPAGERKRIFDKFVRGEAARALGVKGTGIGLAMVKHIVAAHGGSVEVAGGSGKGSVFTIALPVRE